MRAEEAIALAGILATIQGHDLARRLRDQERQRYCPWAGDCGHCHLAQGRGMDCMEVVCAR